jgi:predicted Zn-dependent protease
MAELDIASYLNSAVRRAEKLLGNLDAATARQLMLSNEVALILLHYRFGGVAH